VYPIDKQPPGKIKGQEIDGLLIEFYIEYEDELSVGDKVATATALKSIISDVIKQDEYPYAESTPNEPIELILSPLSIISRMTVDIYAQMMVNNAIIGLKEEVRKLYYS